MPRRSKSLKTQKHLKNQGKNKVFGKACGVSGDLLEMSWLPWWASWRHLEISWGRLGRSWECFRASLDFLEVSWKAMCARICQDVDRNPRDVKTLKTQTKTHGFFGCRGSSGGLLAAFWAFLLALWRSLGDVLGVFCGVLEALGAPRRAKTAQDGCKACKDGFKLAGRAQSDQDEPRRVEGKRCRGGTTG